MPHIWYFKTFSLKIQTINGTTYIAYTSEVISWSQRYLSQAITMVPEGLVAKVSQPSQGHLVWPFWQNKYWNVGKWPESSACLQWYQRYLSQAILTIAEGSGGWGKSAKPRQFCLTTLEFLFPSLVNSFQTLQGSCFGSVFWNVLDFR
jgi:hypothetical protein